MADLANSPTWNRALELALQLIGILRAKRVTHEPVIGVQQNGSLVVGGGVQGQALPTSGTARGVRAGTTAPILWSRGAGRTVVPAAVLMHQTNRGGAGAAGTMPRLLVTGVVEQLVYVAAPDGTVEVWFRNHALFVRLLRAADIPLDSPDQSFQATWGFGDRLFFLRVQPIVNDPRFDYYLIYALNRAEGGPSTASPPSATFVRRVNRPNNFVVDTVDGDPWTFQFVGAWNGPYLGTAANPHNAALVWASRSPGPVSSSSPAPNQVTYIWRGYVVEDVGAPAVVARSSISMTSVHIPGPFGIADGIGTTSVGGKVGASIPFWAQGDRRVAWALQETTTTVTQILDANTGLPGSVVTTGERIDSRLTLRVHVEGATCYETTQTSSATWSAAIATIHWQILPQIESGSVSPDTGQGDTITEQFVSTAASVYVQERLSDGTPIGDFILQPGNPSLPTITFRYVTIAPPSSIQGAQSIQVGYSVPPPTPAPTDWSGPRLTTHRTGLLTTSGQVPPHNNYQWAVINLTSLVPNPLATPPTANQITLGTLLPVSAEADRFFFDVHVVYDMGSLQRGGAT
jgi:hypothetical protein